MFLGKWVFLAMRVFLSWRAFLGRGMSLGGLVVLGGRVFCVFLGSYIGVPGWVCAPAQLEALLVGGCSSADRCSWAGGCS